MGIVILNLYRQWILQQTFLFPLLPCNNTTSISEENTRNKQLTRITDMLGRNAKIISNSPLFYIYDDGSVEKKIILN